MTRPVWDDSPEAQAEVAKRLPITSRRFRFSGGDPTGGTANRFTANANRKGDVYITCGDAKGQKTSLHASGVCHRKFERFIVEGRPDLCPKGTDPTTLRWKMPVLAFPGVTFAFRFYFMAEEMVIQPEQRDAEDWKDVVFVSPAPPGFLTRVTLVLIDKTVNVKGEGRSMLLARQDAGYRWACWVADWPEDQGFSNTLRELIAGVRSHLKSAGAPSTAENWAHMFAFEGDVPFLTSGRI